MLISVLVSDTAVLCAMLISGLKFYITVGANKMAANSHRLIIKNGHIYDPGNGIDRFGDLAMFKNRIVDVMPDDHTNLMIIDADGDLVVPGLIDFHTHIGYGTSEAAIDADTIFLPSGVTTVLDAGTKGAANIDQLAKEVVPSALSTIKCLINLSPTGIVTLKYGERIDPKYFDEEQMKYCLEKYPDTIIGLKIRIMKDTLPDYANTGLEPLRRAIEIAEHLGAFIAVHVTDPPCLYSEIVKHLRPGDVLVHPYQAVGRTIIDENGNLDGSLLEAKKRGVLIDLAGARTNQNYLIARKAIDQGFKPDIYSTDMVRDSVFMKPVFSLPYILSTYKNLGISTADLIKGCTSIPARVMGMEGEIGTLAAGARADIAIFKEKDVKMEFVDWFDNKIQGNMIFEPRCTIKDGRLVSLNMEVKQHVIHKLPLV